MVQELTGENLIICYDACKSKIYPIVEAAMKSHKDNERYASRTKSRQEKRRRRLTFVDEGNTTSSGDESYAEQTALHQVEQKSMYAVTRNSEINRMYE